MSLEQALQENTAALKEFTALVNSLRIAAPATPAATVVENTTAAPAKAEKPAKAAAPKAAPKAEEPKAEAAAPAGPTYDDVKAQVLALSKKGRDHAVAALTKFGVDHATKIKPEQYADFIAHAKSVLGEEALV